MTKKTIALIVAAGRGRRFGGEGLAKQYHHWRGRPILYHSMQLLSALPIIDAVMVVIDKQDEDLYGAVLAMVDKQAKIMPPCYGGASRQDSVYRGLLAMQDQSPDMVLIHDAARPALSAALCARLMAALGETAAAVPTLAVTSALKKVVGQTIVGEVDRTTLAMAQTPQGFHYPALLSAHQQQQGKERVDDAAVWAASYPDSPITTVMGDVHNIKITSRDDMLLLGEGLRTITTLGVDVHQFITDDSQGDSKTDRAIMLGGVRVPSPFCIKAHSDGDVILHALTDAMLGAVGMGDIGTHFPPSDPKWRGADSRIFLQHACEQLTKRGGHIVHVDITLLAEKPKIASYRDAIIGQLARLLFLPTTAIGFKATTTETMGFIGRGEGLAAMVQLTCCLP